MSNLKKRIGSLLLLFFVLGTGAGLAVWKRAAIREANAASANQPEPMEVVNSAVAGEREYREQTTAIGTILATRSITLRNEVPGTVRYVHLVPGQIVAPGAVLVALDVSVEEAELKAHEAQAALAETALQRVQRLAQDRAAPQSELDRAHAERDVALSNSARIKAVIARKTVRAPFRARVGLSNVHPGQYLDGGTELTTLQGVEDRVNVDFAVPDYVAARLRRGDVVQVVGNNDATTRRARIAAIDARVDETTRTAKVRAEIADPNGTLTPGASVRVLVPTGAGSKATSVPVSALRKAPGGDHVFVIMKEKDGKARAQLRNVVAGPVLGDEVLILSGVVPGEQIATGGSFKLRDGALVAPAETATR